MAKVIKYFISAELSLVMKNPAYEFTAEEEWEWSWRSNHQGKQGCLLIYESEHICPGAKYALMIDAADHYIKTSLGEIKEFEDRVEITTQKSIYIFKICENLEMEEKEGYPAQSS